MIGKNIDLTQYPITPAPSGQLLARSITTDFIGSGALSSPIINYNTMTGTTINRISTNNEITNTNATFNNIKVTPTAILLKTTIGTNIQLTSPTTISGLTQISGGLQLPNLSIPSYIPSSLNYFEEVTGFMGFDFGTATIESTPASITRIGKTVHLFLPILNLPSSTNPSGATCIGGWVGGWPTRFLPSLNNISYGGSFRVASGAIQPGRFVIFNGGTEYQIYIQTTSGGGIMTRAQTLTVYPHTFTYKVT
ncbi:hypothetical protein DLAC_03840 [Tieghemostelium lacteum]|uniref:Uncharacterized protein n=1 Tax=Tieghemostelium lacteum TaxID=361077 RepID=A0A152A0V1_TIELA|nr:hypothetical protein DLAC_03840 [Tieghemostelium lacteum]|eukprot:KYQ99881.1 hypothetical protein DLAC_03840 [Tieghemostelium lacteum]